MNQETNLIDLIILFCKTLVNWAKKAILIIEKAIFITIKKWFIVFPFIFIGTGYAIYLIRTFNINYRVEGIIKLNGPTKDECVIKIKHLKNANFLKNDDLSTILSIDPIIAKKIKTFDCYDIIDCLNDGTPDFIDYKKKVPVNDTLYIHMQDRLCFRFIMKGNSDNLSILEKAILDYLNKDEVFILKHQFYLNNLENEKNFYKKTHEKLLSVLAHSYANKEKTNTLEYVIEKDKLIQDNTKQDKLVDEIMNWKNFNRVDTKIQNGNQPVVLLNHLTLEPTNKYLLPCYALLGWLIGLGLALLWKKRNVIYEKYNRSI